MKYIIKVFLVFIILVGSLLTNTQNNTHAEENDEHWKKSKKVEYCVLVYQQITHQWNLKRI